MSTTWIKGVRESCIVISARDRARQSLNLLKVAASESRQFYASLSVLVQAIFFPICSLLRMCYFSFKVVNYEPRPTMKLTPPSDAADRRPLHFNYIRAVTKLPVNFTPEELEPIYRLANSTTDLTGKLRSTFIVLSDDVARSMARDSARGSGPSGSGSSSGSSAPQAAHQVAPTVPQPTGHQGSNSGRSHRDSRSSRSSSRMEHDRSRSRSPLRGNNEMS